MRTFTALLLLAPALGAQMTLSVPAAFPTIQGAIVAAQPGDVVDVQPGTYVENIDFLGKAITVRGSGAGLSVIDGGSNGSVVTFQSGETSASVLEGFTITNGTGTFTSIAGMMLPAGGGIFVLGFLQPSGFSLSPTIRKCEITGNMASHGGGVSVRDSARALIEECTISANIAT